MKKYDFIKIINEEISDFNFLGVDDMLKEQAEIKMLQDENFQKQFIIDSITNFREKIKIVETHEAYLQEPEYEFIENNSGNDKVIFEYSIDVEYTYNDNVFKLGLDFNSNNLGIYWDSEKQGKDWEANTPPFRDMWYTHIEWLEINPELRTVDFNKIPFISFENAGAKTQELFIRAYTEDIIKKSLEGGDFRFNKPPQHNSINI